MKVLIPSVLMFLIALWLCVNPPNQSAAQQRLAQDSQTPPPQASRIDSLLSVVQEKDARVRDKEETLKRNLKIIQGQSRQLAAKKRVRVVQKIYIAGNEAHEVTEDGQVLPDSVAHRERIYEYEESAPDSTTIKPTFWQRITSIFKRK